MRPSLVTPLPRHPLIALIAIIIRLHMRPSLVLPAAIESRLLKLNGEKCDPTNPLHDLSEQQLVVGVFLFLLSAVQPRGQTQEVSTQMGCSGAT